MARPRKKSAPEWPAYTVERWPIDKLKPYERNARRHSEAQVEQLRASIRTYGWTLPILARPDGTVIAGHGRLEAAKAEGLTEAPVIVAKGWSDEQCRAYALADNKLALNSEWDPEMLALELGELRDLGSDLEVAGWSLDELEELLPAETAEAEADHAVEGEDEVPEVEPDPVSRHGDLWTIGEHRALCGDSTSADAVTRLLGDIAPGIMVTDPPYGVEYDASWRDASGKAARAKGKVENDDRADWREAWALFPGSVFYCWHSGSHASEVQDSIEVTGFDIRAQIIWAKQHFAISRGHYHFQHEPCWYAVRKGATANWRGDRKQASLWKIANANAFGGQGDDERTGHSTQKPVECMRRPILNHTEPGDAVYDPFLGSGTTIAAAETTGRIGLGLELNPIYVDVIVRRIEKLAGVDAVLDGDGRTFAEVSAERLGAAAA